MSMFSPKISLAMTEHSRCQPGMPGPHGDGHDGSPGLADFQSAKSEAERLPSFPVKDPVKGAFSYSARHQSKNLLQPASTSRPTLSLCQQFTVALAPRLELRVNM